MKITQGARSLRVDVALGFAASSSASTILTFMKKEKSTSGYAGLRIPSRFVYKVMATYGAMLDAMQNAKSEGYPERTAPLSVCWVEPEEKDFPSAPVWSDLPRPPFFVLPLYGVGDRRGQFVPHVNLKTPIGIDLSLFDFLRRDPELTSRWFEECFAERAIPAIQLVPDVSWDYLYNLVEHELGHYLQHLSNRRSGIRAGFPKRVHLTSFEDSDKRLPHALRRIEQMPNSGTYTHWITGTLVEAHKTKSEMRDWQERVIPAADVHNCIMSSIRPYITHTRQRDPSLTRIRKRLPEIKEEETLYAAMRDEERLVRYYMERLTPRVYKALQQLGYTVSGETAVGRPTRPVALPNPSSEERLRFLQGATPEVAEAELNRAIAELHSFGHKYAYAMAVVQYWRQQVSRLRAQTALKASNLAECTASLKEARRRLIDQKAEIDKRIGASAERQIELKEELAKCRDDLIAEKQKRETAQQQLDASKKRLYEAQQKIDQLIRQLDKKFAKQEEKKKGKSSW